MTQAIRGSLQVFDDAFRPYPLHTLLKNSKKKYLDEELNTLIKKEKDINRVDWNGNTALHIAAEMGNLKAVKTLIDSGAKIDVKNQAGKTPVQVAAANHHSGIVKFLKTLPHQILLEKKLYEQELKTKLREFFSQGFDVNSVNDDGQTVLHLAADNNYKFVVKYLVEEAKAKVNLQNKAKKTPLEIAQSKKTAAPLVEYLTTGFYKDVKEKKSLPTLEQLKEQGIDINAKNKDGNTALHKAILEKDLDRVKWLVFSLNADETILGENNQTPLDLAEKQEKDDDTTLEIAKALRMPTIHRAILSNATKKQLADLMLKAQTDGKLGIQDEDGNTAAHIAARMGRTDALDILEILSPNLLKKTNNAGMDPVLLVTFPEGTPEEKQLQQTALQYFKDKGMAQLESMRRFSAVLKQQKMESEELKFLKESEQKIGTIKDLIEEISNKIEEYEKVQSAELETARQKKAELEQQLKENENTVKKLKEKHKLFYFDPVFFSKNCLERLSFSTFFQAASYFANDPFPSFTIPKIETTNEIFQPINNFLFGKYSCESLTEYNKYTGFFAVSAWAITSSVINTIASARSKMNETQRRVISDVLSATVVIPSFYYFGQLDLQQMGFYIGGSYAIELAAKKMALPVAKLAYPHFLNFRNWIHQKIFESAPEPILEIKERKKET